MEYTIIRLEESANVHGGAEVFVQVQFTDAATGCEIPCAMWLSDAQTNQYLTDHDALPAIIATWADDAARRFYDENTVTPRQVRLALLADGLLDAVDAYVASQPRAVQLEWEYAGEIRRDNLLMLAAAPALGKTPAELQQLLTYAATL